MVKSKNILKKLSLLLVLVLFIGLIPAAQQVVAEEELSEPLDVETTALVFQSDFGVKNDAVACMKGVAFSINPKLNIFDITHEIEPYNIWEGAYWLSGAAPYWPENTVFVSVVDPGVGTERHSVVLKTKNNQYFVTPDNGTLTLVAETLGIEEVRQIDEAINRMKDSEKSYTFHGRDVYAYTAARLASGAISYEEVGPKLDPEVVMIDYQKEVNEDGTLRGMITVIDQPYGNIWTNISRELFEEAEIELGDDIKVTIRYNDEVVFDEVMPYHETFGYVEEGNTLCYMNSELKAAFAINMGNFSEEFGVDRGFEWTVEIVEVEEEAEELAASEDKKESTFTAEDIMITAEDHEIPATLTMPEGDGPFPLIVMCHGNGSNRHEAGNGYDLAAAEMANRGIASLRFDYIGNGDSKTDYIEFTHEKGVEDALTVFEYALGLDTIDKDRIGMMGWSQGGAIALVAASRNDQIKSVVTWAGALYDGTIDEEAYAVAKEEGFYLSEYEWREPLKLSPEYFEVLQEFVVEDAIPEVKASILALNGSEDDVVLPETGEQIVQLASSEDAKHEIIEGADHTFNIFTEDLSKFEELVEKTISWFENML